MGLLDSFDWTSLIKPGLNLASNLFNSSQGSSANSAMTDWMRQREQQNYDDYMRNFNAVNDYNAKYDQWAAGQSAAAASSSRAKAAAMNSYMSRMAAAKKAEEKNKQRAEKKADKYLGTQYTAAEDIQRPFYQAGVDVIPSAVSTYKGGADLFSKALGDLMSRPKVDLSTVFSQHAPNANLYSSGVVQAPRMPNTTPITAEMLQLLQARK